MRIAEEEIFGPVVAVMGYSELTEARLHQPTAGATGGLLVWSRPQRLPQLCRSHAQRRRRSQRFCRTDDSVSGAVRGSGTQRNWVPTTVRPVSTRLVITEPWWGAICHSVSPERRLRRSGIRCGSAPTLHCGWRGFARTAHSSAVAPISPDQLHTELLGRHRMAFGAADFD
jgi:hypothetical protein